MLSPLLDTFFSYFSFPSFALKSKNLNNFLGICFGSIFSSIHFTLTFSFPSFLQLYVILFLQTLSLSGALCMYCQNKLCLLIRMIFFFFVFLRKQNAFFLLYMQLQMPHLCLRLWHLPRAYLHIPTYSFSPAPNNQSKEKWAEEALPCLPDKLYRSSFTSSLAASHLWVDVILRDVKNV